MRFSENGADIPDELIRAVRNGEVVFLCGAGVSFRAGLPTFQGLTEQVYLKLGETHNNEPAERKAFERNEYDRALGSLEKRTHLHGAPSLVRAAVADLLTAKDGMVISDHLSLLQLSRDSEGRSKILTTNFDTLFERAAHQAGISLSSSATKSIPRPGGPNDYGVMHLHGRISDTKLELTETDLILTSADFGDAYLRDGWASRYIEDRMRISILALVGYAAEDAALRLLLETLDADRGRFRDLKAIYAIDKRTDDSASIWKAKGIKPIEFNDYPSIYASLAEWANYAQNPKAFGSARVASILTAVSNPAKTRFNVE